MMKQRIFQSLGVGAAGAVGGLLSNCSALSQGFISPLDGLRSAAIVFAIAATLWFVILLVRGRSL